MNHSYSHTGWHWSLQLSSVPRLIVLQQLLLFLPFSNFFFQFWTCWTFSNRLLKIKQLGSAESELHLSFLRVCTCSISMLRCSWVFEAELCRNQEKSVPLCFLSTTFELLPVIFKVYNGACKVLVKNHEDKVLPYTFKWYHTQFIHTKMETFPSFIPLPVLDSETAKRYVQLLVCHSSASKGCWKFLEHRLWFWWENQWRVKDMNLALSSRF